MDETTTQSVVAIVDDDTSVLRSMARLLKAANFQSVPFQSAEAFLADPQHSRFDCVIADLQLGGMSGPDLQDQLRLAGVKIPMIFMTALHRKEQDRLLSQTLGATIMRKNESGRALLAALDRLLHRYGHPVNDRCDGGNP